ncbi:butyrophilin subfamily 3 member A3-like isoform X3 [Vicugna pacos]|uniref:Butyrophilin subfamily 3 member A3-like isoform X3 n=1 Tax=Vicugna pacos TaxID=30538 RepID=A0ABM5BYB9_VICPA
MEDFCSRSVLCHLTCLLLLVQLPTAGSVEEFLVVGPSEPIVAVLGRDVALPCRVSPTMSVEDMELRWFRSKFSEAVFIYQNRQEQNEEQVAQYAGRTSLVRDHLTQGGAAVHIHNVQVSDNGLYTCFFRKGGFYEEAILELKVAAPFFPQASPWKLAFLVSLTVLMILLLGAGCYTRREHSTKLQEVAKKKSLCLDKEQDQREKEEAQKEIGELQAQLAWRKSVYLAAWRKAQLYADWRKEKFQACPVTLDPGSAHSDLVISHEKKTVALKDFNNASSDTCSVLGFEGITAGRWYWEVEVRDGDRSAWVLGVCREGVNRKGWYVESPDRGFWVLGRFESGYCARTNPTTDLFCRQFPHKVGVFLDHEEGDVSFYNMTDGSHIFSFPQASFSGALFPYFMLMSGDVSMTVCSMAGGSEGLPVPLNSSSLEEPGSLPGEGFCSGCGADALLGAQSPLLPCNPGAASP